jgi:nucleotide-binding universal stress UspA family protein
MMASTASTPKESTMLRLLVPVDGSANSDRAVKYVIEIAKRRKSAEVLALNVQPAVSYIELMLGPMPSVIEHESQSAGRDAARSACALFDEAGVAYTLHVEQGEPGEAIAAFAQQRNSDLIVMGTRGMGAIGNLVLGSVATKVIHATAMPVMVVK